MFVVLIPAYKPDGELIKLVEKLSRYQLGILVVDDGSGAEYENVFAEAERYGTVIHASSNEGKGAALKRGMCAIKEYFPDCTHFITADSDGQHSVEDIIRVREQLAEGAKMVLTVRDFAGNVPARSRVGNCLSRWVYTLLTGHYLMDNQSGLRGYSIEQMEWLKQVKGEKYDYEMNTLYYADKLHVKMSTLPIHSIYIDGNKSSHFTPVPDTLRIYRRLFSSAASSLLTALLCQLLVIGLTVWLGYDFCYITIPLIGAICGVFCMIGNGTIFCKVRYKDAWWTLLYMAIRFCIYTAACVIASLCFPQIPLWLVFDVTAVCAGIGRYYFHKNTTIKKQKNK